MSGRIGFPAGARWFVALPMVVMLAGSALAQMEPVEPYPPGAREPSSGLELQRIMARQQARAVWRRFSPQWLGIMTAGMLPATATPVAGESATAQGWSLWTDSAFNHMRDRDPARASKGHSIGATLGLDHALSSRTVLGASLSHTRSISRGTLAWSRERTRNTFVSLYLNHQFANWLSLDVQGGYVHQRQRRRYISPPGILNFGMRHSNGFMVSGALNAWKWVTPKAMLSGRLGIIASRDRWKAYTEYGLLGPKLRPAQTEALVQGVVEAGVSWWLAPVMPHVSISYNRDLYRRSAILPNDRDDFTLSGGVSWFGQDGARGLSLDIGANVIVGRYRQRHWGVAANLKWAW